MTTVTFFRLEKVIGDLEVGAYVKETGVMEEVDTEAGTLILSTAFIPISEIIEVESAAFMGEHFDLEVQPYAEPDQAQAKCGGERRP